MVTGLLAGAQGLLQVLDIREVPHPQQRALRFNPQGECGARCLHRSLLIRQPVSEPTASSASTARLRQIP